MEDLKDQLEAWLSLNRDFLWKIMSHKEKVDAIFRDRSISFDQLLKECDGIEVHLDELKEVLKKLYLVLYEIQELAKKENKKQQVKQSFEEDLRRQKEEAHQKAQEEIELKLKLEREQKEAAQQKAQDEAALRNRLEQRQREESARRAAAQVQKAAASHAQPSKPAPAKATPNYLDSVEAPEPEEEPKDLDKELEKGLELPELDIEIKIPENIGGILAFLGLGHWFQKLSLDDQKMVVRIMISEGKMQPHDILERDIQTLRPQFASYCWKTANKLMSRSYDEIATGLLIKGLTVVNEKRDKEMLHIMYAKYFYRQRKILADAYDACINHCEKVIKSYMQDTETRSKPVAPFKLLTMIYEEKNDLQKIINVCGQAIALYKDLPDKSKVAGFIRIKDILEKKLQQQQQQS